MTRYPIVLLAAAFLLLAVGVGTAAADSSAPDPAALVASAQALAGSQPAAAPMPSTQHSTPTSAPKAAPAPAAAPAAAPAPKAEPAPKTAPAVPVPPSAGDTTQANGSVAGAGAVNGNATDQSVGQSQTGGGTAIQAAGQAAKNDQTAKADADSKQKDVSNVNVPIRILSPGSGGDVTQSNTSLAGSLAANGNHTKQGVDQDQTGGSKDGGTAIQAAGQFAENDQKAKADADSSQHGVSNLNVPIRILSPGSDGDVEQSNTSAAIALAGNGNKTDQWVDQDQTGGGGSYTQAAGQAAKNDQTAKADADSEQKHVSNLNVPIRILSPGGGGDVKQSNTSVAGAGALNLNGTHQGVDQDQTGGGGSYTQAAGQAAKNDQYADADADSTQKDVSNLNVPIRILSPGKGGDVTQSNTSLAGSLAANGNKTDQWVDQDQTGRGSGTYIQAAGQLADSKQKAKADADSSQYGVSNLNVPIRIGSPGSDGDVTQSNLSAAAAIAANGNFTKQGIDQDQTGAGGAFIQAAGQAAYNKQYADADADSTQKHVSNLNVPILIGSKGHDGKGHDGKGKDSKGKDSKGRGGDVTQSNTSIALAPAINLNKTDQWIDQDQTASPVVVPKHDTREKDGDKRDKYVLEPTLIQAAGQLATSEQVAKADADSKQYDVDNANTPIRLKDDAKGKDRKERKDGKYGKDRKEKDRKDGRDCKSGKDSKSAKYCRDEKDPKQRKMPLVR